LVAAPVMFAQVAASRRESIAVSAAVGGDGE
jgi:hypothetical protein